MFDRAWRWIKLQRQGILYGAAVGAIVYFIYAHSGSPALFSVESPSILDNAIDLGIKLKVFLALTLAGASIGAIIDSINKPGV